MSYVRTPAQLAALEEIKTAVYYRAQRVEDHDFQAFAALMDAYLDLRRAEAEGKPLPVHKARYVGEKVARIFGDLLADPKARRLFLEGARLEESPGEAELRARIDMLARTWEAAAEDLGPDSTLATPVAAAIRDCARMLRALLEVEP